jgi:hypothetical protein
MIFVFISFVIYLTSSTPPSTYNNQNSTMLLLPPLHQTNKLALTSEHKNNDGGTFLIFFPFKKDSSFLEASLKLLLKFIKVFSIPVTNGIFLSFCCCLFEISYLLRFSTVPGMPENAGFSNLFDIF